MTRRVFLVGYMGCGKSTIGRFVARDMGWRFIDMDSYFEQREGCTISSFFAEQGEEAFRQTERDVVRELAAVDDAVIATGGGAPCFFDNMEVMRTAGLTIYINVEPEELAYRLRRGKERRPLIAGKTDAELIDFIKSQLAIREPFYRKAEMVVDGQAMPFSAYKMFIETFCDI